MLKRLKIFLRQELDVFMIVGLIDLISFHYNSFRFRQKIRVNLNAKSQEYNSDFVAQEKYLNYKFWLKESLIRIYKLKLHRTKDKNILDIGTGAGYFPFLCNELSHKGYCLDVPDNDLYDQITDSLGLVKFKKYINRFEPLELETKERFDYITAFMICFNNHKQDDLWNKEEWNYFILDLQKNYLKKEGKILLNFNEESPGFYFTSELISYFKDKNYEVNGNNVLINNQSAD